MEVKKEYYLFFDIDGTVLVDGKLPKEHARAMKAAQAVGHKLMICTGRSCGMFELVKDSVKEIPWDGAIFGGADIRFAGEILSQKRFPSEVAFEWLEFCMENRYFFGYEGEKVFYPIKLHQYQEPLEAAEKARIRRWLRNEMENGNPPTKVAIFESRERLPREMIPMDLCDTIIHDHYVEVFAPGCSKGGAIVSFCEQKAISLDQCVCFGDSLNDRSMFEVCPTSICMKNAPEELIRRSTYQAKSDFGVAEGIFWLFGENLPLTTSED